jgi:hypothetical protein
VCERSVLILRALREAAASDEAARARLAKYDITIAMWWSSVWGLILDRPPPEDLVDASWALVSPEVFTMLTE